MEYVPEPVVVPEPRKTRRAASFCAFAAVGAILIAYAILIAFSLLTARCDLDDAAYSNLSLLVNTAAIDFVAMPLAWLIFLKRVPKDEAPEIRTVTPLSARKLLFLFPCAFLLMYVGVLTGKLIGALFGGELDDVVGSTIEAVSPWVVLISTVLIAPVAEELFFRKAMIDRLSAFHPTDAILFSALLFGLIHGNLTQFLYAFPLGILFGIVYYRTQNIRYTILLHVAVNTIGGLVPQLLTMLSDSLPEGYQSFAMLLYSPFILAMCVLGLIFLIRRRKNFLPIPTARPRLRSPFYLNAGFIVACIVFTALFVLTELPLSALLAEQP